MKALKEFLRFSDHQAIHDYIEKASQYNFKPGTVTSIIGKSGSGKSTLLKILSFKFGKKNNSKSGMFLFLDEPEGQLKKQPEHIYAWQGYFVKDLKKLCKKYNMIAIIATHHKKIADDADDVICLTCYKNKSNNDDKHIHSRKCHAGMDLKDIVALNTLNKQT